jgi:hypothetical protein
MEPSVSRASGYNPRMDKYADGSTITIDLAPRWWQFIRRYRAWRNERAMIGKSVNVDGQSYVITAYTAGTRTATIANWDVTPTSRSTFGMR